MVTSDVGATTVLRSRRQPLAGAGFGVFVAVVGLAAASRDATVAVATTDAVVTVLIGGFLVAVFTRMRVMVRDDGIVVCNGMRRRDIPWGEVRGFRIGRHGLLGAVCLVELADGTTQHASAIQLSGPMRGSGDRERGMIDLLNEQAAAHRAG